MNNQRLKAILIENALYYDAPLNEARLRVLASDLSDLPVDQVAQAFLVLRRDKARRQMPLPADVRALVHPEQLTDKSQATTAAARILEALGKFGSYRSADAKNFVGELGWRVVEMQGGWQELCRTVGDETPTGVAQAQWIKLGESLIEMGRAGRLHEAPQIPEKGLAGYGVQMKSLLEKKP